MSEKITNIDTPEIIVTITGGNEVITIVSESPFVISSISSEGIQGPRGPAGEGGAVWGGITGNIDDQADLKAQQDAQDAAIQKNADDIADNSGEIDIQVPGGAGMLSDTVVTIATATSVNISAGNGFISTNSADGTVSNSVISWDASTEEVPATILAVDQAFYITKNSIGVTQFHAFPIDETVISAEIAIVSVGAVSGSLLTVGSGNFGAKNQMVSQTLAELFLSIGPALEGVELVPDSGDMTFDVTEGAEFFGGNNWRTDRQNPNHFQFSGLTDPIFIYAYQDPAESNGWSSFTSAVIDPDQWDDGSGTIASVPNNEKVTIQPLWISVTTGTVIAQLGQATYKDVATALAALPTAAENAAPAVANLPRLGWLVVTKDQTILSDATYIKELQKGTSISPSAAVKMQDTYDNTDAEPEILTDSIRGAVTFQRGSAADSDTVLEILNGAGSTTFSVDGNGNVTSNNLFDKTADTSDDITQGVVNLFLTSSQSSDIAANTAARHAPVTVSDTAEIDLTLSGQEISATIAANSIAEGKLNSSVNSSLDLADSALQNGDNVSELSNDAGYLTSFYSFNKLVGTGTQSVASTLTAITWDSSDSSIGSDVTFSGVNPTRLTVQTDGVYRVAGFCTIQSGSQRPQGVIEFIINGTPTGIQRGGSYIRNSGVAYDFWTIEASGEPFSLLAGDYVEMGIGQATGNVYGYGGVATVNAYREYSKFWLERVN